MPISKTIQVALFASVFVAPLALNAIELHDPTRPMEKHKTINPVTPNSINGSWILESTLVASDRRVAMINGKLVREGEIIDGARVIRIRNHDVIIQSQHRRLILKLLLDVKKNTP